MVQGTIQLNPESWQKLRPDVTPMLSHKHGGIVLTKQATLYVLHHCEERAPSAEYH